MNAELMGQYINFVADRLLVALGAPKHYNTPNPFEWMEQLSLQCASCSPPVDIPVSWWLMSSRSICTSPACMCMSCHLGKALVTCRTPNAPGAYENRGSGGRQPLTGQLTWHLRPQGEDQLLREARGRLPEGRRHGRAEPHRQLAHHVLRRGLLSADACRHARLQRASAATAEPPCCVKTHFHACMDIFPAQGCSLEQTRGPTIGLALAWLIRPGGM